MDNRAVGIFDSGLGGLTAVMALRRLLPGEKVIYFGDTGRVPYGGRSRSQIRRMAVQDLDYIAGFGVKAIIVACGTISSNAPDILERYPIPAFGVLKAGVRAMSRIGGDGPLGVIATEASIRSGAFEAALREACPGREILAVACPDFVPLIESGHYDANDALLRRAVEQSLAPLREAGVSGLLLGCTHYGIIAGAIRDCLGKETRLVSASGSAAEELRDYLLRRDMTGKEAGLRLFTSGSGKAFTRAATPFLGYALDAPAEEVPVMEV